MLEVVAVYVSYPDTVRIFNFNRALADVQNNIFAARFGFYFAGDNGDFIIPCGVISYSVFAQTVIINEDILAVTALERIVAGVAFNGVIALAADNVI